jgi:hypothetical protein
MRDEAKSLLMRASSGVVVVAFGLGGCGVSVPTGELGNGQFLYQCTPNSVDPGCSQASPYGDYGDSSVLATTTLPRVIAVGASFVVSYTPIDGDDAIQGDTGYLVTPASTHLATVQGESLVAQRSGYLALLAMSGDGAAVSDFVFVEFAPIASITATAGDVSVSLGSTQALSVSAADAHMDPLAGQLACTWRLVSGGERVSLSGPTDGASVGVEGLALGDAKVAVACGAGSTEILVHVTQDETDGGVPQGDAGSGEGGLDGGAFDEAGSTDSGISAEGGDHG